MGKEGEAPGRFGGLGVVGGSRKEGNQLRLTDCLRTLGKKSLRKEFKEEEEGLERKGRQETTTTGGVCGKPVRERAKGKKELVGERKGLPLTRVMSSRYPAEVELL